MNSYSVVCPYFLKKRVLESKDPTDRVKFYTCEDIASILLPTFSSKTLEYVYLNYADKNLSYALTLLKSLKYIKRDVSNSKSIFLQEIYDKLKGENLLEFNEIDRIILKRNPVKLIGLSSCGGLMRLLEDNGIKYELVDEDKYVDLVGLKVEKFENKRRELIQTVNSVGELLDSGVKFEDIAVVCPDSDMDTLCLIGDESNVIFSYKDVDLSCNFLADKCLKLVELGDEDQLAKLLKNTDNTYDNQVKNKLLNTLNQLEDDGVGEEFFLVYLKRLINASKLSSRVGIHLTSNVSEAASYKYVFLLNFDESYPVIHKNSDYLIDEIKAKDTYMEESVDLNQKEKTNLLMILSSIENLRIFLPENDEIKGEIYPSDLIEEENIPTEQFSYSDSDRFTSVFDQLDYAIMNANYKDYGVTSSFYLLMEDIFEKSYVKYAPNDKSITCEFDTSHLRFSYSSMSTYAKCPFRYLIENVYRIREYGNNKTILNIGTMCHYYLEKFVHGQKLNFEDTFKSVEEDYSSFSVQDRFYFKKSYQEVKEFAIYLEEFLDAIGDAKKIFTEQEFDYKLKGNYNLHGFVDLIVSDPKGFIVVDYKTGKHDLKEDDIINGFDMQLPFYTYVVKSNLMPNLEPYAMFYITLLQPDSISKFYDSFKFNGLKLAIKDFFEMVKDKDVVKKYMSSRSSNVLDYKEINQRMFEKMEEIMDGILSFEFPVTKKTYVDSSGSRKDNQCKYCNFKDVCFIDDNSKQVIEIKKIRDIKKAEEQD